LLLCEGPGSFWTHFHGRSNVTVDPSLFLSLTPALRITKSFKPSPKDTTARTESKMRMTMAVIGFAKRRWQCMILPNERIQSSEQGKRVWWMQNRERPKIGDQNCAGCRLLEEARQSTYISRCSTLWFLPNRLAVGPRSWDPNMESTSKTYRSF
jgi:hypothetical protein